MRKRDRRGLDGVGSSCRDFTKRTGNTMAGLPCSTEHLMLSGSFALIGNGWKVATKINLTGSSGIALSQMVD